MNRRFSNYVTATGFLLALTKHQIMVLETLAFKDEPNMMYLATGIKPQSEGSLFEKGLISYDAQHEPELTKEGKLTLKLLHAAGLLGQRTKITSLTLEEMDSAINKLRT